DFVAPFYFVQDAALEIWRNVGDKHVFRIHVFCREFRIEIGEDVQFGGESYAFVEIFGVTPRPEKAFSGGTFKACGVDATAVKYFFVFGREIVADDADEIDVSEIDGGKGEIGGGTADDAVLFSVCAFAA